MRAVWMVRSRQIARKLAFWLAIIGYNTRDHSLGHRIYLVYAGIFMSGWCFAVLSLFAGAGANLLNALNFASANLAVAQMVTLTLLAWALYTLWQVTRRSPFVFSENDAYLICQTPAPRSAVAVAWFVGDWFEPAALFWAGAVTLGFSLVEPQMKHHVVATDLPLFIAAGLRALSLIGLLQLGLTALLWAIGALRLQRSRSLPWLPILAVISTLAGGLGLLLALMRGGLASLSTPFWQTLLWPLVYPAQAAFGMVPYLNGLLAALLFAGLGLLVLAWAGNGLNLSRAAQETTLFEKVETAWRYGQRGLARDTTLQRRLGIGRAPTRLPTHPELWMLPWKDIVQSASSLDWSDLWSWLVLWGVSWAMWLAPDLGSRGLAIAIWSVLVGQRVTTRLQKDLAYWSLLRQLPFSSRNLLLAELGLPWALIVLLAWVTLALAGGWLGDFQLVVALLLPFLTAAISFAAAYDLLRQTKSDMLLNGNPPSVSLVGGLLGLVCLVLSAGVLLWLGNDGVIGGLSASAVALALSLVFWNLTAKRLQELD